MTAKQRGVHALHHVPTQFAPQVPIHVVHELLLTPTPLSNHLAIGHVHLREQRDHPRNQRKPVHMVVGSRLGKEGLGGWKIPTIDGLSESHRL